MIDPATREQVRKQAPIETIAARYLSLQRKGREFKALCPFHGEKTPSFAINPEKAVFYCYGCHAGGDVFDLVQRLEGVEFPEAVEMLADELGIQLTTRPIEPEEAARRKQQREELERRYAVLATTAEFFHQCLVQSLPTHASRALQVAAREIALDHIAQRGVSQETINEYEVGYAPAAYTALRDFLHARGHSPADAEAVNVLFYDKQGRAWDRFRHRIMMPVHDRSGRVVAFSGRALAPPAGFEQEGPWLYDRTQPKYVNSREGIFRKKDVLLGWQRARADLRGDKPLILVEGNFDVLAFAQLGHRPVMAPMGTALTEEHVRWLSGCVQSKQVILAFDGDPAGRKATREAAVMLLEAGLDTRVVQLPPKQDPDSCLRDAALRANVEQRLAAPPRAINWLVDDAALFLEGTKAHDVLRMLAPYVARLGDMDRRAWLRRTMLALEMTEMEVRNIVTTANAKRLSVVAPAPREEAPEEVPRED